MLERLFGPATSVGMLKEGLGASSERLRGIAHRVANAVNGPGTTGAPGFEDALAAAGGSEMEPPLTEEVDLESEMVALADQQIRYDASAGLLARMYQQLRSSVRSA